MFDIIMILMKTFEACNVTQTAMEDGKRTLNEAWSMIPRKTKQKTEGRTYAMMNEGINSVRWPNFYVLKMGKKDYSIFLQWAFIFAYYSVLKQRCSVVQRLILGGNCQICVDLICLEEK